MMTTRTGSAAWQAVSRGAAWADLGVPGVVDLVGDDARRFCNGMFTNNVRDLAVGAGQQTARVDDRGRLTGLLDLFCVNDTHMRVRLEGESASDFMAHYERFVVFDDVELVDRTGEVRLLTLQGPDATTRAAEIPGVMATVEHARCRAGGVDLWLDGSDERAEASLQASLPVLTPAELDTLRVLAGVVHWPDDMAYRQLPHELGLRQRVLHFEKGCYLGQESINRIDVMGSVKRALAVLVFAEGAGPSGASVHHDGKEVGVLTSPVQTGEISAGLAVLRKPADAPGTPLEVRSPEGRWSAEVAAP